MHAGRLVKTIIVNETEAKTLRKRRAEHLFMTDYDFGKHNHGLWLVKPPGVDPILLDVASGHRVIEHAPGEAPDHPDGCITVAGPPFESKIGLLKLEKGNWHSVEPPAADKAPDAGPERDWHGQPKPAAVSA